LKGEANWGMIIRTFGIQITAPIIPIKTGNRTRAARLEGMRHSALDVSTGGEAWTMKHQEKTLLIVSIDRNVNNFLRTIINNIIGGEVKVRSRTFQECAAAPPRTDVVMTSGAFLLPRLRSIYPDLPIVAPKRLITGYNLEKVLMLPRASRVLVVNDPRAATEETIDSLKSLGITHLDYVPYWRGSKRNLGDIAAAISPGMTHLCPGEIKRVIDIGPRIISIHSFLQLLLALDLDPGYVENFATYYHNFLMESSRKLAAVLEQSELLRRYQEVILNQFEDGLLSVKETGRIDIANQSAARLFKKDIGAILARNINDLLAGFKHTVNLTGKSSKDSGSSSIYDHDGKQILIQKIPVVSENEVREIYTFREIARLQRLEKDVRLHLARKGHVTKYGFDDIWTLNGAVDDLKERALQFAATEKNILITGESGTGKELFAHAIHRSSPRRDGPFVAVNFAGIPEGLIESELFGYESGAFTGAKKGGKTGFFEQAHGGTIFLDEIGDAPLNVQSRLLRVLQEKEIMKVGADRIIPIDVRIIAGTNRNLREAIAEKKFRRDLYHRLNTLPLDIPPLREHCEDIPYVLNRYLEEQYGSRKAFSPSVAECLRRYGWPGNVRELLNLADYLQISSRNAALVELEHVPRSLSETFAVDRRPARGGSDSDHRDTVRRLLEAACASMEELSGLLHVLRERKKLLNGRRTLMRELGSRGHFVSEGRMKRYLRLLRNDGLIRVGTTKQGTTLTPKGEGLLEFLVAERGGSSGPPFPDWDN